MKTLTELFQRLHHDETGEMPIGPMLIIGLIVIPLVFLLIYFKDEIVRWTSDEGADMMSEGQKRPTNPF